MDTQETLAKLAIWECDLRVSFVSRFLAVEDIDAQFGEDRAEILLDLLFSGLLWEVADEDFHSVRRER